MIQEITIYIVIGIAAIYVVNRIRNSFKKKQACAKCELMQAVTKDAK
jgi:uncharacterized membrane protein YuzA (DUF378 family)